MNITHMFQLLTTAKVSIFVFVLMTEYFNIGESGETTLTEISLQPMRCGPGGTYCKARYLSPISQMAGIAYHRGIREFTSVIIFNYCLFAQ